MSSLLLLTLPLSKFSYSFLLLLSVFTLHFSLSALAELLWGHRDDDGEEAEAVTACRGGDEDEARTCREPATLSIRDEAAACVYDGGEEGLSIRDEDEARKSPARMMPLLPLLLLKLP